MIRLSFHTKLRSKVPNVFFTVLILLTWGGVAASSSAKPCVMILVSQRIRPYILAVEGLKQAIKRRAQPAVETETLLLSELGKHPLEAISRKLNEKDVKVVVAVGPEAARLVWLNQDEWQGVKVYTMVYNPRRVLGPCYPYACGVSLNISCADQVRLISSCFPQYRRIGILWSEESNLEFVKEAVKCGSFKNLRIFPIGVSSQQAVLGSLARRARVLDGLWMIPDRVIASESLIQLIIEQMLLQHKAVIGFNRFFFESGAALSFILEYKQIGRQTASIVMDVALGKPCQSQAPAFHALLNLRILRHLGVQIRQHYPAPIRVEE